MPVLNPGGRAARRVRVAHQWQVGRGQFRLITRRGRVAVRGALGEERLRGEGHGIQAGFLRVPVTVGAREARDRLGYPLTAGASPSANAPNSGDVIAAR